MGKKRRPQYKDEQLLADLGAIIKNRRLELGFTQEKLAHQLDIDDSNLRRIESGKVNTSVSMLQKILKSLDLEYSFGI